jgi:hypothetical protein
MPPSGALRPGAFVPAPELATWAKTVFLTEVSDLYSDTHREIEEARIAYLWAEPENARSGRIVLGTAATPRPPQGGDAWARARFWYQVDSWFASWWASESGDHEEEFPLRPDFLITVSAPGWLSLEDVDALRLVKHELLHCRQQVDQFGAPKFHAQTGEPLYRIQGHDSETFVEEVEWFGPDADTALVVEAASRPPLAGRASISRVCGSCLRAAA